MSDDFKIEKNNEGVEQPQTASNGEHQKFFLLENTDD